MQLPSALAVTQSVSSLLMVMLLTAPLCSLSDASKPFVFTSHIRTSPLPPPVTMRRLSDVLLMDVTPCSWASWMMNFSVPDSGWKARILPSSHPERIVLPSGVISTQRQWRLGT